MNINELIQWAREQSCSAMAGTASYAILRLLGDAPAMPCANSIAIGLDDQGAYLLVNDEIMSLEDAHGLAVAILRKVEEARKK